MREKWTHWFLSALFITIIRATSIKPQPEPINLSRLEVLVWGVLVLNVGLWSFPAGQTRGRGPIQIFSMKMPSSPGSLLLSITRLVPCILSSNYEFVFVWASFMFLFLVELTIITNLIVSSLIKFNIMVVQVSMKGDLFGFKGKYFQFSTMHSWNNWKADWKDLSNRNGFVNTLQSLQHCYQGAYRSSLDWIILFNNSLESIFSAI